MRYILPFPLLAAILAVAPGAPARPAGDGLARYFQYLSPPPAARLVRPETSLIFRTSLENGDIGWTRVCRVDGSVSGLHLGEWIQSDDAKSIVFRPHEAFFQGETVKVSVVLPGGETLSYEFFISPHVRASRPTSRRLGCLESEGHQPRSQYAPTRSQMLSSAAPMPPDFPQVQVTHSDNPENGYIFVSNYAFSDTIDTPFYLMILDNAGQPVFFRRMENATLDFKKQPNGLLTYFVLGRNKFHAMDSTYAVVDSFATGNGYTTDFHDLQLLPNGHALLMSYDPQAVDMSQVVPGGNPNATVEGLVIQELDTSKNVVFQWRSWDHFEITDSNVNLTGSIVDYVHGNSIDLDTDGNILLSSRHLDEITKIDRTTGAIIWRMGGSQNQFVLQGDTRWFSRQHHVRRISNGNITLFDNGNVLRRSRSLEYSVDESNLIVTRIWEYLSTPPVWGYAMGSSQRLTGGNTLIGWGSANPTVTEVRPDGTKSFEMTLEPGVFSYRAYRYSWSGTAAAPYLWATKNPTSVTLGFVKFGDDNVSKYYIYQDEAPNPTTLVDSTTTNSIDLFALTPGVDYHFRVTARSIQSTESPFSNEVSITMDSPPTAVQIPTPTLDPAVTLGQNVPNPFNPSTVIPYRLGRAAHVRLAIYDVDGRLVRRLVDELMPPASYYVEWNGLNDNGTPVASGVYYYRLSAGTTVMSRALTVLK